MHIFSSVLYIFFNLIYYSVVSLFILLFTSILHDIKNEYRAAEGHTTGHAMNPSAFSERGQVLCAITSHCDQMHWEPLPPFT